MEKIKFGENFSAIPEEIIPYKGEKKNRLTIKNSKDKRLIYYTGNDIIEGGDRIFTDDASSFLTWDDINDVWKPYDWFEDFIISNNITMV